MASEITNWQDTKRRLRMRWPALEDGDLEATNHDRDALLALLEGRFGYAHENAAQDLDQILNGDAVVPAEVANEESHTGTSGPVNTNTSGNGATGNGLGTAETQMRDRMAGAAPGSPVPRPQTAPNLSATARPESTTGTNSNSGQQQTRSTPSTGANYGGGESGYAPGGVDTSSIPKTRMPGGSEGSNWDTTAAQGARTGFFSLSVPMTILGVAAVAAILFGVGKFIHSRRHRSRTDRARAMLDSLGDELSTRIDALREKIPA